jgi:hypothetical protein
VVGTKKEITAKTMEANTTNIANIRYSAFKKADAPSWMELAIETIFPLPGSCFNTQARLTAIKINPMIDITIGKYIIHVSIII